MPMVPFKTEKKIITINRHKNSRDLRRWRKFLLKIMGIRDGKYFKQ
jgi:hypothetical protein